MSIDQVRVLMRKLTRDQWTGLVLGVIFVTVLIILAPNASWNDPDFVRVILTVSSTLIVYAVVIGWLTARRSRIGESSNE